MTVRRIRRSFAECPNCGAPTPDAYCPSCGQRNLDLHASVRALVGEVVEETIGADSRILRTFRALVFRPGLLSREYRLGRRARYASPFKVYLASGALRLLVSRHAVMSHLSASYVEPQITAREIAGMRAAFATLGPLGAGVTASLDRLASADPASAQAGQRAVLDAVRTQYSTPRSSCSSRRSPSSSELSTGATASSSTTSSSRSTGRLRSSFA